MTQTPGDDAWKRMGERYWEMRRTEVEKRTAKEKEEKLNELEEAEEREMEKEVKSGIRKGMEGMGEEGPEAGQPPRTTRSRRGATNHRTGTAGVAPNQEEGHGGSTTEFERSRNGSGKVRKTDGGAG
jgi:hypothetical protein